MARKTEGRIINVSVIGLSGTEREKGQYGVGKSCLCNRFIHQITDKYHLEHISVLSQSDFAGRVINNDHFLFWGETTRTDEGNIYTFQVVEQTEFIDDVSFQPFKTGRTEPYLKRSISTKVQSAEKLMYICKDQLGMETDNSYEQKLMPEGRLIIDGFLCCFDVSMVPQRSCEKQVEFVASLLTAALKTKKPVVLVTTKHDDSDEQMLRETERLLNRREIKNCVQLVETSAHKNVNVDAAFMLLAHMIDRTKTRFKILPYVEAARQNEIGCQVAAEAYQHLLQTHVLNPGASWNTCLRQFKLEQAFCHYVDLFGTEKAHREFLRHIKDMHDDQITIREKRYLHQLPHLLKLYFPDLENIADRGWGALQQTLKNHPEFHKHFVEVCLPGESWKSKDAFVNSEDEKRIPFDLLSSSEAEICFRNHLNDLQIQHKKKELRHQFKKLLEETTQVSVGRPLTETYVFLVSKECYAGLTESERCAVYEDHQQELRSQAQRSFHELLWEHSDLFLTFTATQRFTHDDLSLINQALHQDERYQRLSRMEEERKVMILNHLGFLQCPSRDRCYYRDECVDNQLVQILEGLGGRSDMKDDESLADEPVRNSNLNLVILGKDGLATTLNHYIRSLCCDDEYTHRGVVYGLDYRPVDGDVSREQNALVTSSFKPHGCICVFNSEATLDYVQNSLEQSLLLYPERDPPMQGIPVVLMQASLTGLSQKRVEILQDRAQQLAIRDSELQTALETIIFRTIIGLESSSQCPLRITMCIMCGDPFPLKVPLGPLLKSEGLQIGPENPYSLTLQAYLESHRQPVEVEVTSYHGRPPLSYRSPKHGYILVYSAQRRASMNTLRSFASRLPAVPKLIIAVADSDGAAHLFFKDCSSQVLIREGNQLADELGALFMTTTATFTQQTAAYLPFFREVLDLREQSEAACLAPIEEPCPPAYEDSRSTYMDKRPPAPLPKYYDAGQTRSNTSNSQSTDSEPVYDQPNLYQSHYSDSEHERASSASPPATDDIYCEVQSQEQLVKPSFVFTRRNINKAWALNDQQRPKIKGHASFIHKQTSCSEDDACCLDSSDFKKDIEASQLYQEGIKLQCSHKDFSRAASSDSISSLQSQSSKAFASFSNGQVYAPLAVPEPVEIADYSLVKDAVTCEEMDRDYALVDDALPPGQLHRIFSAKTPVRYQTDSGDSDSSPVGWKKESRGQKRDKLIECSHLKSYRKTRSGREVSDSKRVLRQYHGASVENSSSQSDESDTADELNQKQKQKASHASPRTNQAQSSYVANTLVSGGDLAVSSEGHNDETLYESVMHFKTLPLAPESDSNDNSRWSDRFRSFRTLKEPGKQRKKEERKRLKEEGKKSRETQKSKWKKKDGKTPVPAQKCCLEDFLSSLSNPLVPLFVEKCVNYIEAEGMNTEGIYRIPGNRGQGELFINKFKEDPNVDIAALEIPVNAVATVLKSFFNDLTEPLVPTFLHDELIEAAGMPDKSSRLLMLRGVVKKLPEQNLEVLKFLICHLYRVSERHAENNMDAKNLSRCWWPTILRMEFSSYESMLRNSSYPEDIVLSLIEQCSFFFLGGDEV
ncbi:hypothetical protein C0Q70_05313 [Pomacea canaliculata]|uniref:Rho-GAP domain-containing protein n=1 Tax=Pomacea canaliculata TaxID=400727 RepID=A0A2T7PKU3_POMCA|nr:hypothetical protein C0Q70_05313 [Pomacea canaliculata]